MKRERERGGQVVIATAHHHQLDPLSDVMARVMWTFARRERLATKGRDSLRKVVGVARPWHCSRGVSDAKPLFFFFFFFFELSILKAFFFLFPFKKICFNFYLS